MKDISDLEVARKAHAVAVLRYALGRTGSKQELMACRRSLGGAVAKSLKFMSFDEAMAAAGFPAEGPEKPAPGATFNTKVIDSGDYQLPFTAVWRDPVTTLTAVQDARTRSEARQLLSEYPEGPPEALWLPTDE
jgi:hypothetical protein